MTLATVSGSSDFRRSLMSYDPERIKRLERRLLPTKQELIDDAVLSMAYAGMSPDGWQRDVLTSTAQRMILCCTRQGGKSVTAAVLALHEALFYPGALILLLSPSMRQSGELFRAVMHIYDAIGRPVATRRESALQMELTNRSRVVSLPDQERTIRAFSGVRLLVIDEASRVSDALYYTVRPMLAVSGGRLIMLSTPFGKGGFFYREWEEGSADWKRVRIMADQCPRITPEFLAEERESMGELWFRQEYQTEFVDATLQFFPTDLIESAFMRDVEPLWTDTTGVSTENIPSSLAPLW